MSTALTPHPEYVWNAETIKGLRKFLRMSQSSFSKQLGVRQQTVSEWETGVYEPRGASATLLSMIASNAGFGVPASPAADMHSHTAVSSAGYSNGRVDTSRITPAPTHYDPIFPPAAPSTEQHDDHQLRPESSFGQSLESGNSLNGISRREVPM